MEAQVQPKAKAKSGPGPVPVTIPPSMKILNKAAAPAKAEPTKAAPKAAAKPKAPKAAPKAPEQPAPEPVQAQVEAPPASVEAPTEVIDIDDLSATELEKVVAAEQIAIPDGWAKMSLKKKKDYLNTNFGSAQETEAVESDIPVQAVEQASAPPVEAPPVKSVAVGVGVTVGAPKGKKKPKPIDGEIITDDMLGDVVHEIENLGEMQSYTMLERLSEQAEIAFFKVGGILSRAQKNSWFHGQKTLRDFVELELGMSFRKAYYYINIYDNLCEAGIPWVKVKDVGWVKLSKIADSLTNDNVDDWVQFAIGHNVAEVKERVKLLKNDGSAAGTPNPASEKLFSKSFKLYQGQKDTVDAALQKMKETVGTEHDSVSLELICTEYLAGPTGLLKKRMQHLGPDACLELMGELFGDVLDMTVTMKGGPDENEDEAEAA